jgi:Nucleotidyl transferase AbiEii toxin, Type IV TA system
MGREGCKLTFHPEALSAVQSKVLRQLGPVATEQAFYLAGGTALAGYLGHRRSVDLDWFSSERMQDALRLAQVLGNGGVPFVVTQVAQGTLHGRVSSVRASFLEYRYPLLAPQATWPAFACSLASLDDIACMKLSAVAQRGAKKDFIDLYALGLQHRPLPEMLDLYQRKYGIADIAHVLYALAYFDEADRERMPRMLWPVSWRTIKQAIRLWVRQVTG